MLTLAGELGVEGREGRPVGTLFVIGDSDRVLAQSHQLVINPFHGYPENERNILDPRLEETIKEFSAIDGAFIVRGDGVILAAGRYLAPRGKLDPPLPHGLGTRHEAAASITAMSQAPRPLRLAIDGHGLDLQGRPAGHRHPQALGPHRRLVVSERGGYWLLPAPVMMRERSSSREDTPMADSLAVSQLNREVADRINEEVRKDPASPSRREVRRDHRWPGRGGG